MKSTKRILIIFFFFLAVSFPFLAVTLCHGMQDCEEIELIEDARFKKVSFGAERVKQEIAEAEANRNLSATAAKGFTGELLTRAYFEANGYRSIVTLFANKGCPIRDILQDGSGHGIDDIFVKLTPFGWIDTSIPPIFNEAKFRGNGRISIEDLEVTQHCRQTTFTWIKDHLGRGGKRVGARVCTPTHDMAIQVCSSCKSKTLESLEWLAAQLRAGKIDRTVSVVGNAGIMAIYQVLTR